MGTGVQAEAAPEVERLLASLDDEAAATHKALTEHRWAYDDHTSEAELAEHKELLRQLGALPEHVARAQGRDQEPPALRAELATLLSFAKTLRLDAEVWRSALEQRRIELEQHRQAEREERERVAVERQALLHRRDALQAQIDQAAREIGRGGEDLRHTLPVIALDEGITVCSAVIWSARRRFRSAKLWLVTLDDAHVGVVLRPRC